MQIQCKISSERLHVLKPVSRTRYSSPRNVKPFALLSAHAQNEDFHCLVGVAEKPEHIRSSLIGWGSVTGQG